MDLEPLRKILLSLRKFSNHAIEFTIEANPESLTTEKLSLFLDEGVNRISIGAQSFDNSKLKRLGRLHDGPRAIEAITNARKIGFNNIGIDLIFGVWDEAVPAWKDDLKIAADLPITHISCYGLTYEQGTSIKESVKNGSLIPLEEEIVADMYNLAISNLADSGFRQYEISSFSKPGFCCKHNYTYWNNDPYTGLGPSAVSYVAGLRQEEVSDVSEYIRRKASKEDSSVSSEKLSPKESAKETAALRIRTMEGIDFDWFKIKTGYEFLNLESEAVSKLEEDGLVEYKRTGLAVKGLRLTPRGVLFCDTVSSAFL